MSCESSWIFLVPKIKMVRFLSCQLAPFVAAMLVLLYCTVLLPPHLCIQTSPIPQATVRTVCALALHQLTSLFPNTSDSQPTGPMPHAQVLASQLVQPQQSEPSPFSCLILCTRAVLEHSIGELIHTSAKPDPAA